MNAQQKKITLDGRTALYELHELELMHRLTERAKQTSGDERTAILNEIRCIHELKTEFSGSRFLEEAIVDDHPLFARTDDPLNSHLASIEIEEREGSTATLTHGAHKHRILDVYAHSEKALTDTEAWRNAGLSPRSCGWHRCSDLLDAGAIREVGDVIDIETGMSVRSCAITDMGREALLRLATTTSTKIGA